MECEWSLAWKYEILSNFQGAKKKTEFRAPPEDELCE